MLWCRNLRISIVLLDLGNLASLPQSFFHILRAALTWQDQTGKRRSTFSYDEAWRSDCRADHAATTGCKSVVCGFGRILFWSSACLHPGRFGALGKKVFSG